MKSLKTAICTALAAAVLMVPAIPASASENGPTPILEECGTLPDLSKWGWHWPC